MKRFKWIFLLMTIVGVLAVSDQRVDADTTNPANDPNALTTDLTESDMDLNAGIPIVPFTEADGTVDTPKLFLSRIPKDKFTSGVTADSVQGDTYESYDYPWKIGVDTGTYDNSPIVKYPRSQADQNSWMVSGDDWNKNALKATWLDKLAVKKEFLNTLDKMQGKSGTSTFVSLDE